jgi:hypothetical protein
MNRSLVYAPSNRVADSLESASINCIRPCARQVLMAREASRILSAEGHTLNTYEPLNAVISQELSTAVVWKMCTEMSI